MNIIKTLDELLDILTLDSLMRAVAEVGCEWKSNSNEWYEMGIDDLDIIEMIMFLEKLLDINIDDIAGDRFINESPSNVYTYIVTKNREDKLNKLDI